MKINPKLVLIGLNGKPFKDGDTKDDLTLGRALANVLSIDKTSTDPMRSYILAQKFYSSEDVEVNQSDMAFVERAVKDNTGYYPVVKGQLLEMLESVKIKEKPETPQQKEDK